MSSYSEVVKGVRAVFMTGRTKDIEWRREQLNGILRMLDEQREAMADALKKDLNKHAVESMLYEVDYIRNDLIFVMDNLSDWMKPEKVGKNILLLMDDAYIRREPYGVTLILGAWNYPIQLTLGPMIGALAAGNCIVLKPSELSPNTAKLLEDIIPRYLDKECIKVINGGIPETSELLNERFDYIFYTGNPQVAKIVYAAAAKHLTPVTLELGGKSPAFVDDTSDLSVVARRLVWGKFTNAGQTCIAPDYVMCTKDVQGRLVESCKETIRNFYGENPESSDSLGRIVNDRHFSRVKALMSNGRVSVGGKTNEKTKFIEPTILTDIKPTDEIMQEEIFGPVLPILTVKDSEEAISIIIGKEKPLAMYIFSKDKKLVDHMLSRTSSGGACVNDTLMHGSLPTLPFGGVGSSGMGSYHGKFSFETFSHRRSCLIRAQGMEKLNDVRYPPYNDRKLKVMTWILKKTPKSNRRLFATALPLVVVGIVFGFLLKMYGWGCAAQKH